MTSAQNQSIFAPEFRATAFAGAGNCAGPTSGSARPATPTVANRAPDAVQAAWYPRTSTAPPSGPDVPQGGFFDVLGNLMDQLDAMIAQLLGGTSEPTPGQGSPAPADPKRIERYKA